MDAITRLWRMVSCGRDLAERTGQPTVAGLLVRAESLLMKKLRRRARKARNKKETGEHG